MIYKQYITTYYFLFQLMITTLLCDNTTSNLEKKDQEELLFVIELFRHGIIIIELFKQKSHTLILKNKGLGDPYTNTGIMKINKVFGEN